MKTKNYSVNPFWDKRCPKSTDEKLCTVKLTIYLNSKQFRVSLGTYATKADFDKAVGSKSASDEVKKLRNLINENVSRAENLLEKVQNIDKEKFQRLFKSNPNIFHDGRMSLFYFFDEREREFMKEGRYKTGRNTKMAGRSLKAYRGEVFIQDVDLSYLKGYKAWMEANERSFSTTSMYLRELRTIINKAKADGIIESYPFKGFPIGTSAKSKSVLYPNQLKAFWTYKPKGLIESRAKALFFFCYLCNGMNMKDAVYLKFKNIKGNILSFVREKTKRTNNEAGKEIRVYINEEVRKIIDTWGTKNGNENDFIFPIIPADKDAIQREKYRAHWQRRHNLYLNKIGKKLGFDVDLCFNLSRHSFATMLKLKKTPVSFISEALGHASMKTTEHYMKSLPNEKAKEISDSLLKF